MPLYDQHGIKVFSNDDLHMLGNALLDAPLPMRWTHTVLDRLNKVKSHPEDRMAPGSVPMPPKPSALAKAAGAPDAPAVPGLSLDATHPTVPEAPAADA